MIRLKVDCLILFFILITSFRFQIDVIINSSCASNIQITKPDLSVQYEYHDPIFIYSNDVFSDLAVKENWIGNGTPSAPYIIDGYEIRDSGYLIEIQNTDVYFQIRNCLLMSGDGGISIYNVENGEIFNNILDNFEIQAIEVYNSRSITITNNSVNDVRSWAAISLMDYTEECKITNNLVMNTDGNGIFLSNSFNNYVFNNTAFNNAYVGVRLESSSDNIISTNTLFQNHEHGIWLFHDNHRNEIINNVVFNNTNSGIFLKSSDDNFIANNTVYGCKQYGVKLDSSQNNTLSRNFVFNNHWSGCSIVGSSNTRIFGNQIHNHKEGISFDNSDRCSIIGNNITDDNNQLGCGISFPSILIFNIYYSSDNNLVKWNTFIGNQYDDNSQVLDEGIDNVFINNYWDEWTSPDLNTDGIVDNPYKIDGAANNRDFYPLTSAIRTRPVFIDGNVDFQTTAIKENWPGDGSKLNPYVIDDIFIGGLPDSGLIDIRNTRVHFHINNSRIIGGIYGVVFANVTNGFISNTNISDCVNGIYCNMSQIGILSDNNIFNNDIGIRVRNSSNNTIANNNFYNNSKTGIAIIQSRNNTIINNIFSNDGLYLFGWNIEECLQKEVSGNVVNGKSLIFWQSIDTVTVPSNTGQVILINCSNIKISNLNLSNSNTGLFASFSSNLQILNNDFSNNNDEGLWLFNSTWVTITDNKLINNGFNGITLHSSATCTISDNTISENKANGIYLDNSGFITISNNSISKNHADGIQIVESHDSTLSGNIVTRNNRNSLSISSCSRITVSDNRIFQNNGDGLFSGGSSHLDIRRNIFDNNYGYGVCLGSNQSLVWDNIFSNCNNIGICLTGSFNSNISNNIVRDNAFRGIVLSYSGSCMISHNIVSNNTDYGIYLENSGNSSIIRNNIYGIHGRGGWLGWEGGTGIGLSDSNNCTISQNNVSNGWQSISIWNSLNNVLSDNFCSNNKRGISLSSSGNNQLVNNVLINEGIIVEGWQIEHYLQTEVNNNTVNGKMLVYWQNRTSETVPSGVGQVILVNCESITVVNQNLSFVPIGVLAYSNTNLKIQNNRFINCSNAGINVKSSRQSTIIGNNVSNSETGILLQDFQNAITVSDNFVYDNEMAGIWIGGSESGFYGTISGNTIINNGEAGLELINWRSSSLTGNTVSNNNWFGIRILNSHQINISKNFISNNEAGIELYDCSRSNITNNVISYNHGYGIILYGSCIEINVRMNDFIRNNLEGTSQAYDDGYNNEFIYNYWSNWGDPDTNADGIIDKPYNIDGEANNQDKYPRASAIHDTDTDPTTRFEMNVVFGVILLFLIVSALVVLIRKQKIQ